MNIGIIGGGGVAQTLGAALAGQGHHVTIGLRNPSPAELAKPRDRAATLADWATQTGAKVTDIATAAGGAEVIINATSGAGSLEALAIAGSALDGKVLIDVANPLDFSHGMPPFLMAQYAGPSSLGEQIQAAHPRALVVKAFNTIAAAVMVTPGLVKGDHDLFIAGNDAGAKATVTDIAHAFGWVHIVDLGDISGARASESLLPVWAQLFGTTGSPLVNVHVAKG
jgi:8-hydroxy-5-deazaflavin:NADPH oxidoreductase